MKEEELQKELLKLPEAAWYAEEEAKNADPAFSGIWTLLVRKRVWMQEELNRLRS